MKKVPGGKIYYNYQNLFLIPVFHVVNVISINRPNISLQFFIIFRNVKKYRLRYFPSFFFIKNTFSYSSLVNCNGNTRCRQDQHILPRTRTQNDDAKSVACFRLHLAYLQRISFGQGNPCSWFLSIHISAIFHHRVSRKHDRIDRVLLLYTLCSRKNASSIPWYLF